MSKEKEMINHPEHYNVPGRKECIVEMEELFSPQIVWGFCACNEYKYAYRAGHKGDIEQDAKKAVWYQQKAKELLEKYYYPAIKKATKTKTPESVIDMLKKYYGAHILADTLADILADKDAEIEELKAEVEELKSELDDFKEQICDLMEELEGD